MDDNLTILSNTNSNISSLVTSTRTETRESISSLVTLRENKDVTDGIKESGFGQAQKNDLKM